MSESGKDGSSFEIKYLEGEDFDRVFNELNRLEGFIHGIEDLRKGGQKFVKVFTPNEWFSDQSAAGKIAAVGRGVSEMHEARYGDDLRGARFFEIETLSINDVNAAIKHITRFTPDRLGVVDVSEKGKFSLGSVDLKNNSVTLANFRATR